jgi:hypothetical protein
MKTGGYGYILDMQGREEATFITAERVPTMKIRENK